MSSKSSSYARGSEIAEYSDNFRQFSEDPVSGAYGQIAILEKFSEMRQSVFRAELLQTMTRDEITEHAKKLRELIEENIHDKYFKLSFHLQGDATEKSSHIHIWGDATEEAENIIQKYIYENNLTVEEFNNISFMSAGEKYDVTKNEVIQTAEEKTEDNKNVKITTDSKELFFAREEKEFDELMRELDEAMEELEEILNIKLDNEINYEEVDISIVDEMLKKDIRNTNYFEEEEE